MGDDLTLRRQLVFWTAAFAVFIALLWLLREVLLPFVAGLVLAYVLDPVADRLQRLGMGRTLAAVVILLIFVLTLLLGVLLLLPIIGGQIEDFVRAVPGLVRRIQALLSGPGQEWLRRIAGERLPDVQSSVGDLMAEGAGWLAGFLRGLWAGGKALLSVVSLFVVTPVVAFYMLVDFDKMRRTVDEWTPIAHRGTVRELANEMDRAVAGFMRGQALVCLLLGLFYATGLSLVGLNFGLLIGLGAGLISFIPFVGSLTGLLVSGGVAIAQFWPDPIMIGVVIGIFALGQFIEGNILSPALVGRSVGIHPVWLMFALFAFGYLFGFVGLLVAVPLAAVIGVLWRFALGHYLSSRFYTGAETPTEP